MCGVPLPWWEEALEKDKEKPDGDSPKIDLPTPEEDEEGKC